MASTSYITMVSPTMIVLVQVSPCVSWTCTKEHVLGGSLVFLKTTKSEY